MDAPTVPDLDRLLALPSDPWGAVLAAALPVLRALPDAEQDAVVRRLVAVPPSRLVAGRSRTDLARLLRRPGVWRRVSSALDADVVAAATGDAPPQAVSGAQDAVAAATARATAAEREAAAARERATSLRERLEDARRAEAGATARAERAERRAQQATAERDVARAEAVEAADRLARAAEDQRREVERERRRHDAEGDRSAQALTGARRTLEAQREQIASLRRRLVEAERASPPSTAGGTPPLPDEGPAGGRRGRPSTYPADVAPGTRAAASWLVGAGVPLLVDGYNVSRTQRPRLGLDEQRRWLEGAIAALAQRRQLDATVVWDSSTGASTRRTRRGLTVRYTTAEMTADDELVLLVRTLLEPEDPVVVVTDDVELRGRLAALGADLLDTTSFTWLLR